MALNNKLKIYIDCDDTITESSKTVIDILNKRYDLSKTIDDLGDWEYKTIVPGISSEEVCRIFNSEEFWDNITVKENFLTTYEKIKDTFDFVVVSMCEKENRYFKEKFLKRTLDLELIGIPFHEMECTTHDKSSVDMRGGIHIDDRMDCLETSTATIKILLQNHRPQRWNKPIANIDNLYVVNDWYEIEKILLFFENNREFITNYKTILED